MFKNIFFFIPLVFSSCTSNKAAVHTDRSGHYWDKKWQETTKELRPNRFALEALQYIKTNGKKSNITLLDLGSGNGKDSLFFAEHGIKVFAIDISKNALQQIKETNANIVTQRQDFEELVLPQNSFDIIYAHLSLHYFNNTKTSEILDKIKLSLKPQGLLFIKVKSINDWQYGQGKEIAPNIFEDGHIRHFFSLDTLKTALEGFSINNLIETKDNYDGRAHAFIEAIASKP